MVSIKLKQNSTNFHFRGTLRSCIHDQKVVSSNSSSAVCVEVIIILSVSHYGLKQNKEI